MPRSLESILDQAKKKEKKYDWTKAAELYEQALGIVEKPDLLKKGELQEKIGYCFYRGAFQAENQEEFKERMQRAAEAYEKAHGHYDKLADEQTAARILRCEAVVKYLGNWLTSGPSEKRKFLDECLKLEGKALAVFSESGDMLEYGRMYNELSLVFHERYHLEWDMQTRKDFLKRGLKWGEKAVAALSELNDSHELAKAYFTLATCLDLLISSIEEPEKQEQHRLKVVKYLGKAVDFSEKVGDAHLLGLSHYWLGYETGEEEAVKHYEKTLECGRQTRDNYLIGGGLEGLAAMILWKASATEDPEKRTELVEKGLQFSDEALHHFSTISFMGYTALHGFNTCDAYFHLSTWEKDTEKRLEFLEKSEKAGMKALKSAENSDDPSHIIYVLGVVPKTLAARARIDPDPSGKRSLLETALKYRQKSIEIIEKLWPFIYRLRGDQVNHLAEIKAELADIEPDLDTKRRLLEEAVLSKEKSLSLVNKIMPYLERDYITSFADLHDYQDSYATLLTRLNNLTNNPEHLKKAIEISQKAIESASKLDLVSLIAESYWKIARAQDDLEEYLEAAESFERASENYMKAAEKIPQLKDFYHDHAAYMEAWNEIKKAKHHHTEAHYGVAKEHYKKAAELHESTERWKYLSTNCSAWGRLEEAEDLSRREQTGEAKDIFQKAAELFVEAKVSIKAKLEKIEARDEKEMAAGLVKASDIRRKYCLGRIDLEEAKILDRQGNHTASSKSYSSATTRFQKAVDAMEREPDRQELRSIIYLCKAWEMMTRAEAEASPDLYLEASKHFEKAKDHSLDEKSRILALGHSSFCKALEAGTRFEATRDTMLYSTAKKHLEAATNYYLKAGFKTASEYTKATYRLFDAYIYTNKAQTETDPRKKAQYYRMAEKLLQASAGSYVKAKHPGKSEEIQRLLESVKEERQLATSLTQVLHAPPITSSTTSFTTPNPTHEKAVGLERFEHAFVEANLTASQEVTVGGEVEVRLDLVNVAKEPSLLVRVDNLVPLGLEVAMSPPQYNIENGSIDMKGRRLEPLKVETAKLNLRPTKSGVFNLSPQVIYVDEIGKFKTCKPEPASVTVHPKLAFEFSTKAAEKAFNFLASAFAEDYMRRRLPLEKSGWRTLMQIAKQGKVSKSSVYGTSGRRGRAVSELERRGLVETRVFLGERGRGGKILKMRISYDKETVKRHIDQQVMKIKEK